ncbi:MAG: hypothetical protein WAV32_06395 [Halobacteriota archaeon]
MKMSSIPKGEENDKAIGTGMPRFSKRGGTVGAEDDKDFVHHT